MRFVNRAGRVLVTAAFAIAAVILGVRLYRVYEYSPWTRDGRVRAEVVDVAPEVSGTIVSIPLMENQFVHKGDVLFRIDPTRFRLAIDLAQATVDGRRQTMEQRQNDARRRAGLEGVVSAEDRETFRSTAGVAGSAYAEALAQLNVAKLNLERATLFSPVNGWVTNLRARVGDYATAGRGEISVLDADSFWILGYFEETKLDRIAVGDPATIRLMGYRPLITGHVESIGRGIADPNDQANARNLPEVNPVFTWVRLAQRIPVRIRIDSVPDGVPLAQGMTATVAVGEATPGGTGPHGWLVGLVERLP